MQRTWLRAAVCTTSQTNFSSCAAISSCQYDINFRPVMLPSAWQWRWSKAERSALNWTSCKATGNTMQLWAVFALKISQYFMPSASTPPILAQSMDSFLSILSPYRWSAVPDWRLIPSLTSLFKPKRTTIQSFSTAQREWSPTSPQISTLPLLRVEKAKTD